MYILMKKRMCLNAEGLALIVKTVIVVSLPIGLEVAHFFTSKASGNVFLSNYSQWKFDFTWPSCLLFNHIVNLFWMQETLEDIDKNGDGHVDEDEYIGELANEEKSSWLK